MFKPRFGSVLRRSPVALAMALAVAAVSIAYTHQARAVNVAAQPSTIAVVRLGELLEGLEERVALEKRLDGIIEQRQAQLNDIANKIKQGTEDLQNVYTPGTPEFREKASEVLELEASARVRRETLQARISVEKGTMLVDLYAKIEATATQIAERRGFDAVIIDDSTLELPPQPNEQAALQLILGRRMLYATDRIDITDELRTQMNNNFNAGTP